jgi:tetratricopeptide (TPR) repeat protein
MHASWIRAIQGKHRFNAEECRSPAAGAITKALMVCLVCCCWGLKGDEQEWTELFSRAEAAWEKGRFAEAFSAYASAQHETDTFGKTDLRRAQTLTGLALSGLRMGKLNEGLAAAREAVSILRTHPNMDGNVARALANLALAERACGNLAKAEEATREALQRMPAANLAGRATLLNTLATIAFEKGAFTKAGELLTECLRLQQASLGANHSSTLNTMYGIAELNRSRRKYAEALEIHEKVLRMREEILGPEHPDLAWSLVGYAMVCLDLKRFADTENALTRAGEIVIKALGRQHLYMAMILSTEGVLRFQQKSIARALECHREAAEIAEGTLGSQHPKLLSYLANYAEALRHAKRKQEADAVWQRAVLLRNSFAQRNGIGYTIDVSDLDRGRQ